MSSIVRAPRAPSTLRVSAAAQTPPNMPVLDESTAAGLFRTGDSASGRDAQSSAFLSTPGIDELYSGVEIRIASASSSAALKRCDGERLVARDVVVGVVRRDLLQPVVQLDVDAVGRGRGSAPEEIRVVGPLPEAAADREDLHRYACTSARLAVIFTSLPSAGPPPGSSLFQSMPNSRRSTVVSMSNAIRWICRRPGIRRRADDRPRDRDGLRHAAKRELAVDRDLVAVALDRLRGEAELRELLGVEEVGRLEVADELRLVEA